MVHNLQKNETENISNFKPTSGVYSGSHNTQQTKKPQKIERNKEKQLRKKRKQKVS
jgi:hypothetical protein